MAKPINASARPLFTGKKPVYSSSFIEQIRKKITKGGNYLNDLAAIRQSIESRAEAFGDNIVLVESVHTDEYQRHSEADEMALAAKAVIKIAKNFNVKALGVVTIGNRENMALALDGIHRLILARAVGAEFVPAIIETVDNASEEALIYSTLNAGRRAVSSHSKARSRSLIDPNSDDRKLADILARRKLRLVTSDIGGVDMAKRMIRWQGQAAFEAGVTLHEDCWPSLSIKPEVAAALGRLVTTFDLTPDDGERLVEIVQEMASNPTQMLNAVPVEGSGHRHGIKRVQAITEYLVKQMNVGVRGSARLDPEFLPWSATSLAVIAAAAKVKADADALKLKAKAKPKGKAKKLTGWKAPAMTAPARVTTRVKTSTRQKPVTA